MTGLYNKLNNNPFLTIQHLKFYNLNLIRYCKNKYFMNKTKIFKYNLNNNSKTIELKTKKNDLFYSKYLPSFSKEWKNSIYSFDKRVLSNIPSFTENINKIIISYFNLFFKQRKFAYLNKFILLRRRRNFLRRIFTSNTEIKHTNSKVIITLYIFNRERNLLKKKYIKMNNIINKYLITRFFILYKENLKKIHKNFLLLKNKYIFIPSILRKNLYLKSKIENLNKFKTLKNIYLKIIWTNLIRDLLNWRIKKFRKYSLLYSLNILKFNKISMLWVLSIILNRLNMLKNKKIEYNIVNLKHFTNNPEIFTNIIALKLKRKKIARLREMSRVLNRTPLVNTLQEKTQIKKRKKDIYKNKFKNLRIISCLKNNNIGKFFNIINNKNKKYISQDIYNTIKYKNIGGIRIEVKGRLTKRYRADRSVYSLRWKGGLKNTDSSFQNTTMWRGYVQSNIAYSLSASKRRIGAFAVKGWIAGN